LFQKYYAGERYKMQNTEDIIKEAELEKIDREDVYGDVAYLDKKGLFKSINLVGMTYPKMITINTQGIDIIDSIIEQTIRELRKEHTDDTRRNLEEILNESNPNDRIRKLFNYLKDRPDLFANTVEPIVSSTLVGISKSTRE
jgi:hypothetical protein